LLGLWLFVSRFLWPHSPLQFANTWIVSIVYTSLGVAALGFPGVRYLNALVALWLCVSAFALPRIAQATLWNNLFIAIAMLATTAVPRARSTGTGPINAA
jgi:hypothetical protein